MNILTVTPPPVEPVTLAEVYDHLRLDPDGSPPTHPEDAMLAVQMLAARQFAERRTRRAFVTQRLLLVVAGSVCVRGVNLLRPPIQTVHSVSYYDTSNVLQVVDPANYFVTDDLVPQLQFIETYSLPAMSQSRDALRIEYTAGYEAEGSPPDYRANVPASLKAGVLIGVELMHDAMSPQQREALERTREAILSGYAIPLMP